jgi:hypothetical protein
VTRLAVAAGSAALTLAFLAASAAARTVTVRWRYDDPRAVGFRIYTRHVDQPFGAPLDVGRPRRQDGVYEVPLEVSDTDATYVVVTAYDESGAESPRSNERLFLLPPRGRPHE